MRDDRLLIATQNRDKTREIAELVDGLGFQVMSVVDLDPPPTAPGEVFDTFAANALLKARYYHGLTGCLTLADDSGLAVDALEGAPGVRSARYAGLQASQEDLIRKLLAAMAAVPWERRHAHFICAVAVVGCGLERVFEGRCEGVIAVEPRGTGGFGYDPVFMDSQLGRSYAELTSAEKAARSHRGRALARVRPFLAEIRNAR